MENFTIIDHPEVDEFIQFKNYNWKCAPMTPKNRVMDFRLLYMTRSLGMKDPEGLDPDSMALIDSVRPTIEKARFEPTTKDCMECALEVARATWPTLIEWMEADGQSPSESMFGFPGDADDPNVSWGDPEEVEKNVLRVKIRIQAAEKPEDSDSGSGEDEEKDEIVRAIAFLSGELPVFVHLFSFGADLNVSLHPTDDLAIRDIRSIWSKNKFDPEEDGSIVFSVRLNGEAGEGKWTLTDEGGLISSRGEELLGFSIYTPAADEQAASSEDAGGPADGGIDWNRYELTAQIVATQELTIDDDCTQIDWNSIEEITSTTLIFVRDVLHDIVFDVDVEDMDDERIIAAVVHAVRMHEKEYESNV
ncbi:hypothetical protein L1N85_24135 [Paenibacillus alkaliterrae]|uniref:hypothetical protein n=1 Tax=Paenibacillus alkaliterrae TaxID=320909 RepID=UPI001F226E68|nr:hypothetical protein [Paenibacillus alkaliterrae]MCF2941439.1 hypothetical protein [Paenibacillus alkaliterrae]